jgi:hypothetical protein
MTQLNLWVDDWPASPTLYRGVRCDSRLEAEWLARWDRVLSRLHGVDALADGMIVRPVHWFYDGVRRHQPDFLIRWEDPCCS